MTFASAEERKGFFTQHCASPEGWKHCSVAQMLDHSYEADIRH